MSGTNNPTTAVSASGIALIDGILSDRKWSESTIHYSAPTTATVYDYTEERWWWFDKEHHEDILDNFRAISSAQHRAVDFALNADLGPRASAGFSVEGFTNLTITKDTTPDTSSPEHIRFANTTSSDLGTARVADFPGNDITDIVDDNGDVWFGRNNGFTNPVAGNYEWATHLHEIGHALGLTHGHDHAGPGGGAVLPTNRDAMEYTIMSYNSYVGGDESGYTNETWGYAQTYMMADIAALQHLYGADYTTNAGSTVYTWNPNSGDTLVDGRVAIDAGGNRIFATIWDGGGDDTYDLSAYSSDLDIDLRPGESSLFSAVQQANLGDGNHAAGNVYNALLHGGDTRSLIENAIGGSGDDTIRGNQAANRIEGGRGADSMRGYDGGDSFVYTGYTGRASGDDYVNGGSGHDKILLEGYSTDLRDLNVTGVEEIEFSSSTSGGKSLYLSNKELDSASELMNARIDGNASGSAAADRIHVYTDHGDDVDLSGWTFQDWQSHDSVRIYGDADANRIVGTSKADTIYGYGGGDRIEGGGGADYVVGSSGADRFVFNDVAHSAGAARDTISGFDAADVIDLSGIDAIVRSSFDSVFRFLGVRTDADGVDSGQGGLWVRDVGADTLISANVDDDAAVDMAILVRDGAMTASDWTASDFVL